MGKKSEAEQVSSTYQPRSHLQIGPTEKFSKAGLEGDVRPRFHPFTTFLYHQHGLRSKLSKLHRQPRQRRSPKPKFEFGENWVCMGGSPISKELLTWAPLRIKFSII